MTISARESHSHIVSALLFGLISRATAQSSPSLSINDVAVLEGNSGITYAIFRVALSELSSQTVTVNFSTADGTAVAGNDYIATNGLVTFVPGVTNQNISVGIIGDTLFEPHETFSVNLSNPVNAVIARGQGIGTIIDDESRTVVFTNASPIVTPGLGPATPFPSSIDLSGLPGSISKLTVSLMSVSHPYPDDFDILLVGPGGQKLLLMSDAGGGASISGITLTFDDAASSSLPDNSQIVSGTFKPTNHGLVDTFTNPAPAGPYDSTLSIFNGTNPNGTWSLYVYDDSPGDSGRVAGGWRLSITTTNLAPPPSGTDADLSLTVTDSPDPVMIGNAVTYSTLVINNGPANASGVRVTDTLPAGSSFVSAAASQGSCSQAGGVVTCSLGALNVGASARVTATVTAPNAGRLTNSVAVSGNEADLNSANNTAV